MAEPDETEKAEEPYVSIDLQGKCDGINIKFGSHVPDAIRGEVLVNILGVLAKSFGIKWGADQTIRVEIDPTLPAETQASIKEIIEKTPPK